VAESLGKIGDDRAIDSLIPLLHVEEHKLRNAAAGSLRTFNNPLAKSALNKAQQLWKEEAAHEERRQWDELRRKSGNPKAAGLAESYNWGRSMDEDFIVCPNCYAFLGIRSDCMKQARAVTENFRKQAKKANMVVLAASAFACPKCHTEMFL